MKKTIKITSKDLAEASRTGNRLKEHQDKSLEELIDSAPDLGTQSNNKGIPTEIILMKALKKKERISASWCLHNLKMPIRTAGYGLLRITNKGHAIKSLEKIASNNGSLSPTNVYTITPKGQTWIANQR